MTYTITNLEELQDEAIQNKIVIKYVVFPKTIKALYYEEKNLPPVIAINKNCKMGPSEEACIIAEELGHHYTSCGDLLSNKTDKTIIRKQEEQARRWAVKRIASLKDFIGAFETGCRSKEELADHLNITEEFLLWSIDYYKKRYGLMTVVDEQYVICFEPFGIAKLFREEEK